MSKLQDCPSEILQHILQFLTLDYKKIENKKERAIILKTIHNWQSTCKLFERCELINDFWWSVFERESGYILPNPSIQDQSEKLKKTLIEKGQLKKNILIFLKCIRFGSYKLDPSKEIDKIKLVMLGGTCVGKSALVDRYVNDYFQDHYEPIIEVSYRKRVTIDNMKINLEILDTTGMDIYSAFRDQFIRGGNCFVIVSSIDERNSLKDLSEIMNQCHMVKESTEIPCVLVLNKIDMQSTMTSSLITIEKLKNIGISSTISHQVIETSAKTGHNVNECFETIIRTVLRGNSNDFKQFKTILLNPETYLSKTEKKCHVM